MRAILMMHSVDESGSVLSITPQQLASLVLAIRESGHQVVPLHSLLDGRDLRPAVALTFDDGVRSTLTHAAPLLSKLGAPATLFLTTHFVGKTNRWPSQSPLAPELAMLNWDEVRQLARTGWDIQAHSATHPDLRTLDAAALERELREPIEQIATEVGTAPDVLAYPYGLSDARVRAAAARHYTHALGTRMRVLDTTDPAPDRYAWPRLDTYYFRDPWLHRHFGRKHFRAYLQARALARWAARRAA